MTPTSSPATAPSPTGPGASGRPSAITARPRASPASPSTPSATPTSRRCCTVGKSGAKAVSRRAGHANLSTTLEVYQTIFEEDDRALADISAGLFNRK